MSLARLLVEFLETGHVPDGLFTPDVFCDFTMPKWRLQAEGARDQSDEEVSARAVSVQVWQGNFQQVGARPREKGQDRRAARMARASSSGTSAGNGASPSSKAFLPSLTVSS